MLEAMRQNSRSAIIYILFGILIAAFIISFGPGSPGTEPGGRVVGGYAARIAGTEVSEQDFHFAYVALGAANLPGNMAREQRIKEFIMDRLIEREIFAKEAERMGLKVSEGEAAEMVADGRIIVLGIPRRVDGFAFTGGSFNYDKFRMLAQNHYGVTIKRLMEIQQRELLAEKVRDLTRAATIVSPDEVRADFEDKGRQVNLAYVRVQPSRFEDQLNLTDSDIENFARMSEDRIKKTYEERKLLYEKQDRTVHIRRIVIDLPKDAPPDKVKEAEAKLAAARETLKSGTRFADVARTSSDDGQTRRRGGDMGWLRQGATGLGEAIEKKIFAAKEGDLIGPERSDRGLELIKVEGFRQGDISLGAARTEIAEELLREERLREMARKQAQEVADKVKAGQKLAELFPKEIKSDAEEAMPKAGKESRLSVEETGLFSRRGDVVGGLGSSRELARAVFGPMKVGETMGPLEISGGFVVATLLERKEPDMADFEKRKAEIIDEYQRTRYAETLAAWSRHRCTELKEKERIVVNPDVMTYEGGPARDPFGLGERKYEPCSDRRF